MKTTNILLAAILIVLAANVGVTWARLKPSAEKSDAPSRQEEAVRRWRARLLAIEKVKDAEKLQIGAQEALIHNEAARRVMSRAEAERLVEILITKHREKFEQMRQRAFEDELLERVLELDVRR